MLSRDGVVPMRVGQNKMWSYTSRKLRIAFGYEEVLRVFAPGEPGLSGGTLLAFVYDLIRALAPRDAARRSGTPAVYFEFTPHDNRKSLG